MASYIVVAYYERWSGKLAFLGWTPTTNQSPSTELSAADTHFTPVRQWARWQPQPWLGWNSDHVPSQLPVATDGISARFVVAYYERWSGKLAAQFLRNTVSVDPTAIDLPSANREQVPRPYLFKEYPRQAWLGWSAPNDQDERAKHPDTHFTPVRQWARWQPQPWLGWNLGEETGAGGIIQPPLFASPFTTIKIWTQWRPQPQYGWTPAPDAPVGPTPVDTPFSPLVVAYYERWSAKLAWLGWNAATEAGVPPVQPDTPPPQGTRPWPKGFTLQPWLGWNAAQDFGPTEEGGPEQLLLLWDRGWTLQPWLGWTSSADPGIPALVDAPPAPVVHPFLFLGYRRQPTLGWVQAVDVPPVIAPPTARPKHMPMFIRRIELYNQRNW